MGLSYRKATLDDLGISNNTHLAYLTFDEKIFVGAGGISYFQVMPTYHNPKGKKG